MIFYQHTITGEIREFDPSVLAAHPKAALWVAYTPPTPEPPSSRWRVSKDTLVSRIPDASLPYVMAALASQSPAEQFKFTQSAWFWSDNATLRGLATALGLDPDELLAVDPYLS